MKHLLAFFLLLSLMLASLNTHAGGPGGGFRSSSSSRSSYGGFRSGSSSGYRGFSSSPSRTFTYGRSAAAPRTVYRSPSTSRSTYRSSTRTTVNNHYHGNGSSGGGLGVMDYVILNQMVGHGHDSGPTYVNTQPGTASNVIVTEESEPAVIYQREESHFWRNFFFVILGTGLIYALYRLIRATEIIV